MSALSKLRHQKALAARAHSDARASSAACLRRSGNLLTIGRCTRNVYLALAICRRSDVSHQKLSQMSLSRLTRQTLKLVLRRFTLIVWFRADLD